MERGGHLHTVRLTSTAGLPTPTVKTLLPEPERRRESVVYSVPRRDASVEDAARATLVKMSVNSKAEWLRDENMLGEQLVAAALD
jgi:hypothetical protein